MILMTNANTGKQIRINHKLICTIEPQPTKSSIGCLVTFNNGKEVKLYQTADKLNQAIIQEDKIRKHYIQASDKLDVFRNEFFGGRWGDSVFDIAKKYGEKVLKENKL